MTNTLDCPTVNASVLINAHTNPPRIGSKVLALTHGGVLVTAVWCNNSINQFDAWSYCPKIPQEVKNLQAERFTKTTSIVPAEN